MKSRKNGILFFIILILLAAAGLEARITVRSSAEPSTIGRDEKVTFTIRITSDRKIKTQAPVLPRLEDFSQYGMQESSSSEFSIINGSYSETLTKSYQYQLLPRRSGSLSIPSFNIKIEGQNYSTQPATVRVLDQPKAGSPQSQSNPYSQGWNNSLFSFDPFGLSPDYKTLQDMEISAFPDKSTVYLGEPLLVTYRLYTIQPVTAFEQREEKDFGGYGKEVYNDPTRLNYEQVRYKDRRFQMAEIKTLAISPNQPGTIELPRLTADVQVGYIGLYAQTLQSNPVLVTVRDLPKPGKPADFSGAVGSFKLTDSLDRTALRIGEALEYKLTISGRGNFNQFSNPEYPAQDEFRISTSATNNDIQAGVQGTRTITYALIPKTEGQFTLPGISFNWFDPDAGTYKSFRSAPRTVTVKPGNVLTYLSNVFQRDTSISLSAFNPRSDYSNRSIYVHSLLYWVATICAALTLLPSWLYARNRKLKETDLELAAQKGSARVLRRYMRQADQSTQNASPDFYPQAEHGLMRYLSDKYRIPHRFSTAEKLYQLQMKGLDSALITELEEFLNRCQQARFMPGGFNREQVSEDMETLKKIIRVFFRQPRKAGMPVRGNYE